MPSGGRAVLTMAVDANPHPTASASALRAFFDGDVRWLAHYGFDALDVPTLSAGVGAAA